MDSPSFQNVPHLVGRLRLPCYGRECVRVGASFQMFSMVGNPPLGGQYLQDDISSVIDGYVQQRTRLICAYVTSPCCQLSV